MNTNARRIFLDDEIVIEEWCTGANIGNGNNSRAAAISLEGNERFKFHLARGPTLIASGRLNFPFGATPPGAFSSLAE